MRSASEQGWPSGFVFYDERDLQARDLVVGIITMRLQTTLCGVNKAFTFHRVETPQVTTNESMRGHQTVGFDLVQICFPKHSGAELYLRPETTFGTFAALRALYPQPQQLQKALPCVLYQVGKVFRDEQERPFNELRFKEFYQVEYQVFFAPTTKADYFSLSVTCLQDAVAAITVNTGAKAVPVPPAELAHYAARTTDIMVDAVEVAAISERTDFPDSKVIELSVGLDRLTVLQRLL